SNAGARLVGDLWRVPDRPAPAPQPEHGCATGPWLGGRPRPAGLRRVGGHHAGGLRARAAFPGRRAAARASRAGAAPCDRHARALPGSVVWAGITLVAFALARHFPIDEPPHVRHVLVHISASATLALAEVAIAFGIDRVTGWFNSSFSDLFVNGFPPNVLYYWLLAGLGHGIEVYRRYRIREREALMLQKRLAEAELHLLKTQLQPHFLFHTLHAISALMHRDVRAADRMLTRLSELLRVTLEHVGTNEVSL